MKKRISVKHWLIPNKANFYHPYLLRPLGLALVALLLLAQPLLYNGVEKRHFQVLGYATDISASTLFSLTNQERTQAGLPTFSSNSLLTQAASNKAADMFAKDYWAHNSPDGLTPWSFISAAGYNYIYAGENLAKDFTTSAGVMTGWMNSPEHRDNILSSQYQEIGLAVMNGNLLGSPTTLVVAMYGAPVATPQPAPVSKPPAATTTPTPTAPAQPATQESPPPVAATTPQPITTKTVPAQTKVPLASHSSPTTVLASKNIWPTLASTVSLKPLNWAQRTTIFILSALFLINILKHTLVWRIQKRGRRKVWLRAHPLAQAGMLALAIIIIVDSGYGVIL